MSAAPRAGRIRASTGWRSCICQTFMDADNNGKAMPQALSMLASERPRNLGWFGAGGLLFGGWGTSRLYVLGIAFVVGGRSSFCLIAAMSALILFVGWAYTQICRIY